MITLEVLVTQSLGSLSRGEGQAVDHKVYGSICVAVSCKARADIVKGIVNIKNNRGNLSAGVTRPSTGSGGDAALRFARHGGKIANEKNGRHRIGAARWNTGGGQSVNSANEREQRWMIDDGQRPGVPVVADHSHCMPQATSLIHEKYGRDAVLPRRAVSFGLMPHERHIIRRGLPPSFVANASDEWSSANDDSSIVTKKRNNDITTKTAI